MHHYPHIYLRRPVSRLLWFVIGAGVATWWHHSRAMHEYRAQYWPCLAHQQRRAALPDQAPTTDPIRGEGRWVWKANPSSDGTMGWNQQEWEENKERLKNMQKRVGEAMADMSESTLDSIVSAAEVLKAKLAESRSRRENTSRFDENATEKKKDPSPSA